MALAAETRPRQALHRLLDRDPPADHSPARKLQTGDRAKPGRSMRDIQPADGIRDAATIILLRREKRSAPRILMGRRNRNAIFMPAKFVFPGGAVDPQDYEITPALPLPAGEVTRLGVQSDPGLARALALAGSRELWEEAGLALGTTGAPTRMEPAGEWRSFYSAGYRPNASALRFVYRA